MIPRCVLQELHDRQDTYNVTPRCVLQELHDRQGTYNVILLRVLIIIAAVEKQ